MRAMESSRQRFLQQLEEEQGAETSLVYDVASMPGFRFQPTEEELVGFYLRSMVVGNRLEVELINVLDLYRYDPWELPAMAFMHGEREWLFFCPRDRKYPNGARPNRVTASGYWKATGTDRQVRRAHDARCIGLKKTLVFYTGKAPRGRKTEWIMNEYRLPQNEHLLRKPTCARKDPREVALCRIYKKLTVHNPALCTTQGPDSATEDPSYYPYVDSEQASASTSGTSPSRAFAPCRRPISNDDMDVLCDTLGSCSRSVKLENSPGTVDVDETVELALLNAQRSMFSSPDAARGVGVSVSISADRFSWLRQDVTQLPGDVGGLIDPAGCGTLSSIASMDRLLKSSMFSPTAAHSLLGADENCDIDFPLPMSSLYSSHTHMFGGSSHQPPWLQTISPAAGRQTVGRSQYSAE